MSKETFKSKVASYFESIGVAVSRIEGEEDALSVVCHIRHSDNARVAEAKAKMEHDLNAVVEPSQMFGMNVVIVESNDLDA